MRKQKNGIPRKRTARPKAKLQEGIQYGEHVLRMEKIDEEELRWGGGGLEALIEILIAHG